jgi:glycosyltransferase involved in cell wall biosynthesis
MKISIITVTYNSIKYIKDCLASVKSQSYLDIEHIIVDGASNDGTLSLIESKRKQFATIITEPDKGVYHAMNKGIKVAKGDIVGFLNSDDFYATNEVLSSVAKTFSEDKDLEACYSDLIYVDPVDVFRVKRYVKPGRFNFGDFSKGWCPPHPTFFVKRSVYERYGKFNVDKVFDLGSDAELMMRFLEVKKINVKYIPEIWVKFRVGGISNKSFKNIWKQNYAILNALKKHKLKSNFIYFFVHKLIIKIQEFFIKPDV